MGIYCYTLRSNTRELAGMKIAQYKFAYKESLRQYSGGYGRMVALAHAAADRAESKVGEFEYFIMGDWSPRSYKIPVYHKEGNLPSSFLDSKVPGKLAGYAYKDRGRWNFDPA